MCLSGRTRITSTSQARELNNKLNLTIIRLRNVSQIESGTVVSSVGTGPGISILFS